MVLFTTKHFRKLLWSKSASVYIDKIVRLLIGQRQDDNFELIDDDLRGNTTTFYERQGSYDGLSNLFLVPKTGSTVDYWISEYPDNDLVKLWAYFDHINHNYFDGVGYVRDMSYITDEEEDEEGLSRTPRDLVNYGDPCIVSANNLILPWRTSDYVASLVTNADGIDDCYSRQDHADYQVSTTNFSLVFVFYPKTFAKVNSLNKKVLSFDGLSLGAYLDCGNHADLWSQSLTKFSFSFWIKPTTDGDGVNSRWVLSHGGASNQGFRCIHESDGGITFVIKDSVGNNHTAGLGVPITSSVWHHIVCVYDNSLGSANVKIYVDGVLGATTSNLTEAINLSAILTLAESSNDFQGMIKEFRWWTTIPLTQTDVNNLFAGTVDSVPVPNYYLPLDEGAGTNPSDAISDTKFCTFGNLLAWLDDPTFTYQILKPQKYISKADSATNKYTLWVDDTGVLRFQIKDGGTDIVKKTSAPLSLNTWCWIVVTYNNGTNTIKIYVNGTDVTTADSTFTEFNRSLSSSDLWFLSNANKLCLAQVAPYLAGFVRSELSQALITNFNNNKATFSDLTASQVAWVDYAIPA